MKAILFDLDQTLLDTSNLESLRERRAWREARGALHGSRAYPGVTEALRALERRFKLGIVTMSPRPYAEDAVRCFDLDLPVVVAYHDTSRHKPHPDPLIKAIGIMKFRPDEAAYVGESPVDILAARAAHMTPVAALWGASDRVGIESLKPEFSVELPGGLAGLFD